MIAAVMAEAALPFAAIDRFAVTVGPGHFTGLRVGLATARGLALAAGRPLIGITTLEAIAAAVSVEERSGRTLLVALDSKRDESYVQSFTDRLAPLDAPAARRAADYAAATLASAPLLVAGDGAPALLRALVALGRNVRQSAAPAVPNAEAVAALAADRPVPTASPGPLYLHPAEVTMPAAGLRR